MKKLLSILGLTTSLLFLFSCHETKQLQGREDELLQSKWMVSEIDGELIAPSNDAKQANLLLANGRFSGSTGCNSMSGTYTLSGDHDIKFGAAMMTRMACAGPNTEAKFMAAFNRINKWEISGDILMLFENKTKLLTFQGQPIKGTPVN
ncbi:MAG: hypothetical protein JWQ27_3273 [Ferruginibacter sp.]|nr:hypothetical protein [Ferruginibacter sp.]